MQQLDRKHNSSTHDARCDREAWRMVGVGVRGGQKEMEVEICAAVVVPATDLGVRGQAILLRRIHNRWA